MRNVLILIFAISALPPLASCSKASEKDCRETCLAYVGDTPGAKNYGSRAGSAQEGRTLDACVKVCMDKGAPAVLGYATNRATKGQCEKACRRYNSLKREAGEQSDEAGMIFGITSGSHKACVENCLGGATKANVKCLMGAQTPQDARYCVQ